MERYRLVHPDVSYTEQIAAYRNEFIEDGSSLEGCGSLGQMEDPKEWLKETEALKDKNTAPKNWVVSTQLLYVRQADNTIVGMTQIRHEFNDFIEHYAGHIGYSVRPSERKKGIAKKLLHDCLEVCKELKIDKVLLCVVKGNEGSRKTILSNGGIYESTVVFPYTKEELERYWITL